ncbi:Lon protease [Fulvitalea axinellae]|uniref:Lon protease n=1 Tax=Fulvitalea axinellae TaxID=1182444 RepID=A0AAU9D7X2_9BACT|nr:Lon protease [Fulvitalea axinellae]
MEEENKNEEQKQPFDLEVVGKALPTELDILPVFPRPIFPEMRLPISFVGEENIRQLKEANEKRDGWIGLVLPKELGENNKVLSYHEYGCAAKLLKLVEISKDYAEVLLDTSKRFKMEKMMENGTNVRWKVEYYEETSDEPSQELRGYLMAISTEVKELIKYNSIFQEQLKMALSQFSFTYPGKMVDTIAYILSPDPAKLQEILEAYDLKARADLLLRLLKEDIEVAKLQEKISKGIDEKVTKQQREYFLREQLKAIKKELGMEKEDKESDIEKIESKLAALKLSEEARKAVDDELTKIKLLNVESPEYAVSRNYLELFTDLPWGVYSEDNGDLPKARKILDEDHYGLKDVKDMILEFLSTVIRKGSASGSIICLVGPPGVGKTSVGKSIARALDRKFFRFSVGGMRDEAEIKGHRRTYIGAMPGKFIQCLKRVGTANPVIMLDEIDKIGASYQGDPASALLEVLDPEQNHEFLDHYLDVAFDLSKVLFITTANQLDTIPRPLIDRMEVIRLAGYVLDEKIQIAQRYLWPRQLEENGLTEKEISINEDSMRYIVDKYAREAGVRNMEKALRKIIRKVGLEMSEGLVTSVNVGSQAEVEKYLGKPLFLKEKLYEQPMAGVVMGLAYTAFGGATLYVEATGIRTGRSRFKHTGQLGEVMTESSEIAYSYARSVLSKENEDNDFFEKHEVHLHVPEGATPKDGPSAGVTMALALYSLAAGKPVRNDVAMTGELTLTGRVLPIGGVREKTLAASRVGIRTLIVPEDNKRDVEELPDYVKEGIDYHYAAYFGDILKIALVQ